jgi:hypothetical protein
MKTRRLGIVAALITLPFMGLPVYGAAVKPCEEASVAVYTAPGFQCTVGDKKFTNIDVHDAVPVGNDSVTFGNITPFNMGNEHGLQLSLSATAGPSSMGENQGGRVIVWNFNVFSETPIIDAFLQLKGKTSGTGRISITEQLSNGDFSLTVFGPTSTAFPPPPQGETQDFEGETTKTFEPQGQLHVEKSSFLFSGEGGSAPRSLS